MTDPLDPTEIAQPGPSLRVIHELLKKGLGLIDAAGIRHINREIGFDVGAALDQAAAGQESGWETLNVKVIRFKYRDIAGAASFLKDHLQRAHLPDEIDGETELVLTLITRKAWPPLERADASESLPFKSPFPEFLL